MDATMERFLKDWDSELIGLMRDLKTAGRADLVDYQRSFQAGSILRSPATADSIVDAEKRIGRSLPPLLKALYRISNGLVLPSSNGIRTVASAHDLKLLRHAAPAVARELEGWTPLRELIDPRKRPDWRDLIFGLSADDSVEQYLLVPPEGTEGEWHAATLHFPSGIGLRCYPDVMKLLDGVRKDYVRTYQHFLSRARRTLA